MGLQKDVKGITNFLGHAEGDAIGLINFGHASPTDKGGSGQKTDGGASYDKQTKAIKELASAVPMLDGDNKATSDGIRVRGLTNFTESVKGKAIGGINFGRLAWSDDSEKEGREKETVPVEKL